MIERGPRVPQGFMQNRKERDNEAHERESDGLVYIN